ncbi:hypothetical protein DFH08DRAFT_940878 [Mycena albidolilacea]|uniref:Uncharacterized protein n=1 Tax=Mycena albidolilacea TaxID=1033008 RepID=A0AAD6ZLK7_9AGAR|nr:hypothetical protein DFH08DRAFT_940878 [Mycena albidolilacea]
MASSHLPQSKNINLMFDYEKMNDRNFVFRSQTNKRIIRGATGEPGRTSWSDILSRVRGPPVGAGTDNTEKRTGLAWNCGKTDDTEWAAAEMYNHPLRRFAHEWDPVQAKNQITRQRSHHGDIGQKDRDSTRIARKHEPPREPGAARRNPRIGHPVQGNMRTCSMAIKLSGHDCVTEGSGGRHGETCRASKKVTHTRRISITIITCRRPVWGPANDKAEMSNEQTQATKILYLLSKS